MSIVISVENLSKSYRLGQIGTGTLTRDLEVWWARLRGKPNPLLKIGAVNDSMPRHMVELLQAALAEHGRKLEGLRILVLGYAYLEDSDDTRNSPSDALVTRLKELGARPVIHDPYVPAYQGDLFELGRGCAAAVVMVGHRAYHGLDLAKLARALDFPLLVDGRRVFAARQAEAAGFHYRGIGQPSKG